MRPDNTAPLINAARRRHELPRAKAIRAVRELDHSGTRSPSRPSPAPPVSPGPGCMPKDDIRAEIQRLREATGRAPSPPIPTGQRATETSLLRRLAEANQRNRQLIEENQRLRRQLAHALGDQRTTTHSSRTTTQAALTPVALQ